MYSYVGKRAVEDWKSEHAVLNAFSNGRCRSRFDSLEWRDLGVVVLRTLLGAYCGSRRDVFSRSDTVRYK